MFCKAIIYNLLLVANEEEEVNLQSIVLANLEPCSFFFLVLRAGVSVTCGIV